MGSTDCKAALTEISISTEDIPLSSGSFMGYKIWSLSCVSGSASRAISCGSYVYDSGYEAK